MPRSREAPRAQTPITQLFASVKQKNDEESWKETDRAAKRAKVSHSLPVQNMYDFPKPSKDHEVIDLTTPSKSRLPLNGPRKLVVKNLRQSAALDPKQYLEDIWRRLDTSLTALFSSQALPYSTETLYNEVMILCRQNWGSVLLDRLRTRMVEDLESRRERLLGQKSLGSMLACWTEWQSQTSTIRAIFFYLDRSFLLQEQGSSLVEFATELFRNIIFAGTDLGMSAIQDACKIVMSIRANQKADEKSLMQAIQMFVDLDVCLKVFVPELTKDSRVYFQTHAASDVVEYSLSDYVRQCDRMLNAERQRSDTWGLKKTMGNDLEVLLEESYVRDQQEILTGTDVIKTLVKEDPSSLRLLYTLLERQGLELKLRLAFEKYIVEKGTEIVADEAREQEMVTRLLELKRDLNQMCKEPFGDDPDFRHTLREGFETFINKPLRSQMTWGTDNPKPGEMIAKHVDMILKGGGRTNRASLGGGGEGSSEDEDDEMTRHLDEALDLFRFVHGKAVFEAFYKRDLARRLLLGRSANSAAEKSMLTRLKSGFTHNLEQMFKDIEMAREEISSYRSMLEERGKKPAFDLSVNVLSSAAWPSYPDMPVNVPDKIAKATAQYGLHYKAKHAGRKLEWKPALAHSQIRARFSHGVKELVVSSFQAIVLLAFNEQDLWPYTALQQYTGLDHVELKRTLQSLACARYRVLSKTPKGKEVEVSDSFKVNDTFTHEKFRIKINQIQAKETKQENRQTHERVAADRGFETQAAIVRIMKGSKSITHAQLVSQIISALRSRGPVDPADIKRNIEKLIEKEYMARDEDAENSYVYVA